ncbi:protein bicaudal D isoform X3 [Spodoptera frugiperda]|uniref:Protein bicaudal D isoform X3 n=1 Tax=Spodoptera frugiperda TaxID=7108 RepID=A0A9R0EHV2_SPOFR|nr:protein bicaudal D isoform X3 [Spodoptera frugiperda]
MNEGGELRHELDRVVSERDRLLAESSELGQDKATRESERAALRAELREARQREQRLLVDIGDLEDENISLQKQVSALRSSQVEFEGLKHEVRQLREEAENARAMAEETAALRRIAERQLAEALEALQAEREAKFAAKKELDAHLSREAAYNITNLAYSIRGMPEDGTEDEGEPGGSSSAELASAMGDHHADLFSEVHLHEISRLEKQLEQAHNENSQLQTSMRAAQVTAESESAAAALLRAGLTRAASRVSALHALHSDCAPIEDEKVDSGGVSARAAKWLTWWRVSGGELSGLAALLAELAAGAPGSDSAAALQRAQLAQLADRVAEAEVRCAALQADADLLRTLAGGAGRALSTAGPALLSAAETLAQIYHHVCAVNGTQPERVLLEHAGQGDAGAGEGRGAEAEALALAAGELEGLRAAAGVARSADTLLDQLTHLRTALDTALDSRNRHQPGILNDHYFKPRVPYYTPIKRQKEQNNCKQKIADTKRKLHNLITHLQSLEIETIEKEDNNNYSSRSVKEITDYYENITKISQDNDCSSNLKDTSFDHWSKKISLRTKHPFAPFPNTTIPIHNPNVIMNNTVNLHSLWKNTMLHGNVYCKNVPSHRSPSGIKTSLRSSLVTCVMMLQYIL